MVSRQHRTEIHSKQKLTLTARQFLPSRDKQGFGKRVGCLPRRMCEITSAPAVRLIDLQPAHKRLAFSTADAWPLVNILLGYPLKMSHHDRSDHGR